MSNSDTFREDGRNETSIHTIQRQAHCGFVGFRLGIAENLSRLDVTASRTFGGGFLSVGSLRLVINWIEGYLQDTGLRT